MCASNSALQVNSAKDRRRKDADPPNCQSGVNVNHVRIHVCIKKSILLLTGRTVLSNQFTVTDAALWIDQVNESNWKCCRFGDERIRLSNDQFPLRIEKIVRRRRPSTSASASPVRCGPFLASAGSGQLLPEATAARSFRLVP